MRKFISIPLLTLIIMLIIASVFMSSFNMFFIALSIYIIYKLLIHRINNIIFDSKLFAFSITFFCYVVLLQCAVLITGIINHNFPLDLTPCILFIPLLIILIWRFAKNNPTIPIKTSTINPQDIIALFVALFISMIILLMPITHNPEYIKSTTAISLISGNVDDSAHLSIINDNLQFNRGIIFGSDAFGKTRNNGFYPASWHAVSAVFIKSIMPKISTGVESLWAYGLQKLFWLFILFYLFVRVAFSTYRFISNKKLNLASYLWVSSASSLLGCIFLLPISREGFYSFLPQLIATVLLIPILMQICTEKDNTLGLRILPIYFLVCFGGCLAWFLPLPAFSLSALLITFISIFNRKISIAFKNFVYILKDNLLILLILFSAIFAQLYIMAINKAPGSISFIDGLGLDGGITKYEITFYFVLCIGFFACILFANKKIKKNLFIILSLVLSLLLYCIFIHLVQMKTVGVDRYYFFKTVDILIIAILPISITGLGLMIRKICGVNQRNLEVSMTLTVLAGFILIVGPSISTLAYGGGFRDFSAEIGKSLIKELDSTISQDNYSNKNIVFYYVPGNENYLNNEIANLIAKSNEIDSTCFDNNRRLIWVSPSIDSLITNIKEKCNGFNVDIITDSQNMKSFIKASKNSQVKVRGY